MTRLPPRPPRATATRAVVGIDQSYSGFAVAIVPDVGPARTHRKAFHGKGINRLIDIGAWLTGILAEVPEEIVHICLEDYAPGRKFGREIAGELGAVVKLTLRTHPRLRDPVCYPTLVTPAGLKKYVTGKGTGAKSDMKLHVYKRWGLEFSNDDEADAYGLAQIAASLARSYSPQKNATSYLQWADGQELTGYQNEVLKKLRHHTER